MNNRLIVTSYLNPDLDGTACAIAYSEYLNNKGENTVCSLFGNPHREAQFVLNTFDIPKPNDADYLLETEDKIFLVDASDLKGISKKIDPKQVIELIDHRIVNESNKFPNAKVQIELVGSCATLIAEKFFHDKVDISVNSAALLYSAIISNTVNFKASVTTERDRKMADWLLTKFTLPENYIHKMFSAKSKLEKPVENIMNDELATFNLGSKLIGIVQLEIVDAVRFVNNNLEIITGVLKKLKQDKIFEIIFLTSVDVIEGKNIIVVVDNFTKNILEKALHVKFENDIAVSEGVIMRKSIVPLLKVVLEKS